MATSSCKKRSGLQSPARPGNRVNRFTIMSSVKAAFLSTFQRTDAPRRETLRRELARERARQVGTAERPSLCLQAQAPPAHAASQAGVEPDALRPAASTRSPRPARCRVRSSPGLRGPRPRPRAIRLRTMSTSQAPMCSRPIQWSRVGRRVSASPEHMEEAAATLERLSGRAHRVLTGVLPHYAGRSCAHEDRRHAVRFKHLSRPEIEAYIASREWRGKAGGYAIQGLAGCFVNRLQGSYTNVVGLPLMEVSRCFWPRASLCISTG